MTAEVVRHFIRQLSADRSACGRYIINCTHRTTEASKVTCRACIKHMIAPALGARSSAEDSSNA